MPDSAVTSNMLTIVAEVTDYSKQYLDNRAAFVEKLLGAKSFDSAVRIQSEYAKTSFEGIVVQATKMGELYSNLAKSASIGLNWRWPIPKERPTPSLDLHVNLSGDPATLNVKQRKKNGSTGSATDSSRKTIRRE